MSIPDREDAGTVNPLDQTTLDLLRIIAVREGARSSGLAQQLNLRLGERRENTTSVANRVAVLERRGLVLVAGAPREHWVTPRGRDVAAGGGQCRVCGCTDNDACEDGCSWVEPDLCSSCVEAEAA